MTAIRNPDTLTFSPYHSLSRRAQRAITNRHPPTYSFFPPPAPPLARVVSSGFSRYNAPDRITANGGRAMPKVLFWM